MTVLAGKYNKVSNKNVLLATMIKCLEDEIASYNKQSLAYNRRQWPVPNPFGRATVSCGSF